MFAGSTGSPILLGRGARCGLTTIGPEFTTAVLQAAVVADLSVSPSRVLH
jgi:hypothetical protein